DDVAQRRAEAAVRPRRRPGVRRHRARPALPGPARAGAAVPGHRPGQRLRHRPAGTAAAMSRRRPPAGVARATHQRNLQTIIAATKLGVFTLVSVVVTGTLAAIMGNFGFGDQTEYRAVFTSASMLEKGDDVRVAGVTVGEVRDV